MAKYNEWHPRTCSSSSSSTLFVLLSTDTQLDGGRWNVWISNILFKWILLITYYHHHPVNRMHCRRSLAMIFNGNASSNAILSASHLTGQILTRIICTWRGPLQLFLHSWLATAVSNSEVGRYFNRGSYRFDWWMDGWTREWVGFIGCNYMKIKENHN